MRNHFTSHLSNVRTFIVFWTFLFASRAEAQDPEYSFTLERARQRKTLITKVRMIPSTIKWRDLEVTVGDPWLERRKDGKCCICFQIDKGKQAFLHTVMFFVEDDETSTMLHLGLGLKWVQAVYHLESPEDLSNLRFSLVGDWKEKRLKNIRFVPIK